MATTYTELFKLPKHAITDPFDITLINDSMSIIEKALGARSRVFNLLDNSDFRAERFIAQAGLNGKHGATIYLGDRWIGHASMAATERADGVLLSTEVQNAYIYQKVKVQAGKQYTFAVHATGHTGMHRIAAYNSDNSVIYAQDYATDRDTLLVTFTAGEDIVSMLYYPGYTSAGGSAAIQWVALYPGAYTADTLPEYQPKGYAVELAECMRYYQIIPALTHIPGVTNSATSFGAKYQITPMRIAPTVTIPSGEKISIYTGDYSATTANYTLLYATNPSQITLNATLAAGSFVAYKPGMLTLPVDIVLSADL